MAGGYGGRATKDGIDAIQPHGQNTENSPIEETEVNYPVKITRYELIQDSEGGGRFRGGLGLRRDYCFDHEITFSVLGDRAKFPPWGLCGGQDARPCTYILNPDTNPREFPSKLSVLLEPGDIFSVQMGGGGGYGPASDRQPASVLEDVVAGNISVERAAKVYGVIIDPATQSIDYPGTTAARAAIIARTTVTVSEEDSA
jgi:N-methylhydantoinase B